MWWYAWVRRILCRRPHLWNEQATSIRKDRVHVQSVSYQLQLVLNSLFLIEPFACARIVFEIRIKKRRGRFPDHLLKFRIGRACDPWPSRENHVVPAGEVQEIGWVGIGVLKDKRAVLGGGIANRAVVFGAGHE